ncbi:SlyX family protein [Roseimaritima ulvae]|uniref:SlyX family protein n=1 Tax=Roseimaritima ulvae TaxID=980254 RepID=UPI0008301B89|nr:SlyX family protein [Roseimaritima ulvae]
MSDADRITELEIQLAHQQRITEQLNEVLTEQNKVIDGLTRRLQALDNQVRQLRERPQAEPDMLDEKPPHY